MRLLMRSLFSCRLRQTSFSKRQTFRALASLSPHISPETFIIKSPFNDVHIPKNKKISEDLLEQMEKWLNYVAIECAERKKPYTYGQLIKISEKFSKFLRDHKFSGVKSYRPIALLLPNSPEFVSIFIGTLQADLPITTINPIYTPREIAYQLSNSHAGLILCQPDKIPQVQAALEHLPSNLRPPIAVAHSDEFNLLSNHSKPLPPTEFTELFDPDIAVLPYSSGTTGLPKGVKLSHYNLMSNIYQMNIPELKGLKQPDGDFQCVIPAILPFFHIYGMVALILYGLRNGCRLICLPKFDPKLFIDIHNTHKVTTLFLAPPLILFMSASPEFNKKNLQYVQTLTSGAAPISDKDLDKLFTKISPETKILQGYGMTECSPIITSIELSKWKKHLGSVGIPVPNSKMRVVSTTDSKTNLPPGEVGEIWIQGPQVMKGYLGNEKDTKEMLLPDGWLRTGDLGYYNKEGNFYIVDRLKELIKVKGLQVAPAELEALLRSHPSINDAAVIGINDERSGEIPRAYIVLKSGVPKITAEEVKQFISDRVSEHKQLSGGVEFVETIPKNASGKILRKDIRAQYLSKNN